MRMRQALGSCVVLVFLRASGVVSDQAFVGDVADALTKHGRALASYSSTGSCPDEHAACLADSVCYDCVTGTITQDCVNEAISGNFDTCDEAVDLLCCEFESYPECQASQLVFEYFESAQSAPLAAPSKTRASTLTLPFRTAGPRLSPAGPPLLSSFRRRWSQGPWRPLPISDVILSLLLPGSVTSVS